MKYRSTFSSTNYRKLPFIGDYHCMRDQRCHWTVGHSSPRVSESDVQRTIIPFVPFLLEDIFKTFWTMSFTHDVAFLWEIRTCTEENNCSSQDINAVWGHTPYYVSDDSKTVLTFCDNRSGKRKAWDIYNEEKFYRCWILEGVIILLAPVPYTSTARTFLQSFHTKIRYQHPSCGTTHHPWGESS
jgi:hypothetical protein